MCKKYDEKKNDTVEYSKRSVYSDYSYEKSLGFVEDAQKRGYKPFKCRTIRELGFCLPDCRRNGK